jgi:cyclase
MENLRIMARLDIKGPNVVKGVFTEGLRVVGDPVKLARDYYKQGIDELICMDVVASLYGRNFDFALLKSVARDIFIPITVGGGIRSIDDINNVLRAGADKVAINTYAIKHPGFLNKAAKKFGSQCVVLSVEAKKIGDKKWEAYTDGGREHTGIDAIDWIKKAIKLGIGEIMLTSVDRDGAKNGYDVDLVKEVTSFSPVPVIAHGGAGSLESMKEVMTKARPDALSMASVLHYGDLSVPEIKKYLLKNGFNVRLQ